MVWSSLIDYFKPYLSQEYAYCDIPFYNWSEMKLNRIYVFLSILLISFIGCVKKETLYFDFLDDFFTETLPHKKIAVCTIPAELRRSETTDFKIKTTGIDQYTFAVAKEIESAKKCLEVIYPKRVSELLPDIYNLASPVREGLKNKESVNGDNFKTIKEGLGVDYLLIVERVTLHDSFRMNTYAAVEYRTTSLEYQIWDLEKNVVLLKAKTSSGGDEIDNLFKDYNKKTAAVRIGKEIAGELPKCQK